LGELSELALLILDCADCADLTDIPFPLGAVFPFFRRLFLFTLPVNKWWKEHISIGL